MNTLKIFFHHSFASFILPFSKREILFIIKSLQNELIVKLDLQYVPFLEIFFITDNKISELNKKYMGVYGPTNILTFPFSLDLPGTLMLSLDTIKRESFLYGQTLKNYLLFILAHGFAHVAGFDHDYPKFHHYQAQFEAVGVNAVNALKNNLI